MGGILSGSCWWTGKRIHFSPCWFEFFSGMWWNFFKISACCISFFDSFLSLSLGIGNTWLMQEMKRGWRKIYFTPDLLRKIPFSLVRCLWSQKRLKCTIKCTEWTVHLVESHMLRALLLQLFSLFPSGGSGPLINTLIFSKLSLPSISAYLVSAFRVSFHNAMSPNVHYDVLSQWVLSHNMQDQSEFTCFSYVFLRGHSTQVLRQSCSTLAVLLSELPSAFHPAVWWGDFHICSPVWNSGV